MRVREKGIKCESEKEQSSEIEHERDRDREPGNMVGERERKW